MRNIDIKVSDKGVLTITVNLKKDFGDSNTGKSIIIAGTDGAIPLLPESKDVPKGVKISMTIFKMKPKGGQE